MIDFPIWVTGPTACKTRSRSYFNTQVQHRVTTTEPVEPFIIVRTKFTGGIHAFPESLVKIFDTKEFSAFAEIVS
jgi:hypothetical protein